MKMVCPHCGSANTAIHHPETYRYRESGLNGVVLHGGVTEIECAGCGDSYVHIEREQQLLQVIALVLLMKPGHLTGPEFRYLRRGMELSQTDLAKALGLRRETIAERESKKDPALRADGEFFSRVVLLKAFLEYLKEEDHDHLSQQQRELLNEYCEHVLTLTERVQQARQRKPVQIHQVANDWRPDTALIAG